MTTDTAGNGVLPGSVSPAVAPGALSNTVTGDQPPASAGLTLEAIRDLIRAENAPLREELRSVKNSQAAKERIARKGGMEPIEATSAAASGIDPSKIPDEATRLAVQNLKEREDARVMRESQAAEQAKRDRAANAVRSMLDDAKPARRGLLEASLMPYVKEGVDGEIIYDDGKATRPFADVVRERLSDPVFQAVSVTPGTGTVAGSAPIIGRTDAMAATAAIKDPHDRLRAQHQIAQSQAR